MMVLYNIVGVWGFSTAFYGYVSNNGTVTLICNVATLALMENRVEIDVLAWKIGN